MCADAAMELLRKRSHLAIMLNERDQARMSELVTAALAEGWTSKRLSSEIKLAFADGYGVLNDQDQTERTVPTDARAEIIAQTELNRAQTQRTLKLFRAAEITRVTWVTTRGIDVCDTCASLDGKVYGIDDVPDGGPPLHPSCSCALMAADEDVAYDGEVSR